MISIVSLLLDIAVLYAIPNKGRPVILISLMIMLFTLTLSVDLQRSNALKEFQKPIILGYLLRVFLLYFDLYGRNIFTLPNSGADSEWFYRQGILASLGANTIQGPFYSMLGQIFKIVGDSRIFVQFLLMLFSIVTIVVTARTLVLLKVDIQTRKSTMYVLCLLPNFAIISSLFLRESIVAMFAAISLYYFSRWIIGYSYLNLAIAVLSVLCGAAFHSGIIGMILGFIIILAIYNPRAKKVRISIKTIVPAIIVAFAFLYLFNNYAELFFGKMLRLTTANSIEDIASTNAYGDSSYAAYVGNSNSIGNMILYTPLRLLFFLGSPFFWQIRGANDIIALIFNSLFYLYVIFKTIMYLRKKESAEKNIVASIFIIGIMTAFVFAWGVTNTGTAIRHRDKMSSLYAILLALTGGMPFHIRARNYNSVY